MPSRASLIRPRKVGLARARINCPMRSRELHMASHRRAADYMARNSELSKCPSCVGSASLPVILCLAPFTQPPRKRLVRRNHITSAPSVHPSRNKQPANQLSIQQSHPLSSSFSLALPVILTVAISFSCFFSLAAYPLPIATTAAFVQFTDAAQPLAPIQHALR